MAMVPSGASTGAHEALELRDGGDRYAGRGVRRAVANVAGPLAAAVRGLDACDQQALDAALRAADGTADLSRLGANAVLSVSLAAAVATASATGVPLYGAGAGPGGELLVPMPMVNVISGGAHAARGIDVQDLLVVPLGAHGFAEAIEWAVRVRAATALVLGEHGLPSALAADEGGLGPVLPSNRQALELLSAGIERAGLRLGDDAAIAMDLAANDFYDAAKQRYVLRSEGRVLGAQEWVQEVASWVADFAIVSLEDVMAEDDWDGWSYATTKLAGCQLVGDDVFVTDVQRLERAIAAGVANAVLVKPNQVGTVSDAAAVVGRARSAGYATVLSARSGDTEESWLADLAVAWRTGQIKVGSTTRSERTAKWNRLLRIEAEHPDRTVFAGRDALVRRRLGLQLPVGSPGTE